MNIFIVKPTIIISIKSWRKYIIIILPEGQWYHSEEKIWRCILLVMKPEASEGKLWYASEELMTGNYWEEEEKFYWWLWWKYEEESDICKWQYEREMICITMWSYERRQYWRRENIMS